MNKWKYQGRRGKQMLHIHILSSYVERKKTDTENANHSLTETASTVSSQTGISLLRSTQHLLLLRLEELSQPS